jgi:hypothetical protein
VTSAEGLAALAGAVAIAFILWIYFRREVPVAGRAWLAGVRATTLALLVILLFDPTVPAPARATGGAATWVAVDASLSMSAVGEGETPPWERAVARARDLQQGGATVAAFGSGLRFAAEEPTLLDGPPPAASSRLAPLLERALEAGAGEVVVLSDLRFADPVAVRALLDRGELTVRFEELAASPLDAGVARFELPAALAADGPSTAHVAVHASETAAGRTATVEVHEEDRLVFSRDIALPAPGLVTEVPIQLPAPGVDGVVRYEARVRLAQDSFEADDARVAYGTVDPEEGLLVAVALVPDWELRFLLPVLEQVTGLVARGYLHVGGDRYLPTGAGAPLGVVSGEEVQRRVQAAELLVLQGLSADDPSWLQDAAAGSRRAVLLPADPEGAVSAGVSARAPQGGEWYVSPEIPASPLTSDLAGTTWQGLPPLTQVMPVTGVQDDPAALRVQLRRDGGAESALVLHRDDSGRRAIVLASGFWRWAFRTGVPRESYRRLWAGVAGWLLEDEGISGAAAFRPEQRVVGRDEPVRWHAPGLSGREVTLHLARGDSTVQDTVMTAPEEGILQTAELAPGTYSYRATWSAEEDGTAEGRFDVEAYTGELRYQPARTLLEAPPTQAESGPERSGPRRPLRTHPLPYLLLLGLLCGEWTLRRRRGLR